MLSSQNKPWNFEMIGFLFLLHQCFLLYSNTLHNRKLELVFTIPIIMYIKLLCLLIFWGYEREKRVEEYLINEYSVILNISWVMPIIYRATRPAPNFTCVTSVLFILFCDITIQKNVNSILSVSFFFFLF